MHTHPPTHTLTHADLSADSDSEEDEPDAAGGPGLGAAFKGAALAVALAAFSQVPLGKQDVSIPANDPSRVPVTNFVKVLD